jgi:hypothetical protein
MNAIQEQPGVKRAAEADDPGRPMPNDQAMRPSWAVRDNRQTQA